MMTFIYKKAHDSVAEVRNEFTYGAWVHLENPTDEELIYATETFDLEQSLLTDALDLHEVPRIEQDNGALYLFTRFVIPIKDQFFTSPVLIVYKKKIVITVAPKHIPSVHSLISQKGTWTTYNQEELLLVLLDKLNISIERALTNLSKQIQQSRIQVEKIGNKELMQFVDIENSLYDINALLVRMETLLKTLQTKPLLKLSEDQKEVLEDNFLAIHQMSDLVKGQIRTVVNTRDAISTILTANLNRIIKLFTSLTVLLTIPMIVATFYGMNVNLPFSQSPEAFHIIVLGSLIVSGSLLFLFYKKDWL